MLHIGQVSRIGQDEFARLRQPLSHEIGCLMQVGKSFSPMTTSAGIVSSRRR